jgi:uncharacterized protein YciI
MFGQLLGRVEFGASARRTDEAVPSSSQEAKMTIKRVVYVSGFIALLVTGLPGIGWRAAQVTHAGCVQPREEPQEQAHGKLKQFAGLFKAANPEVVKKGPGPEQMALIQQHVEYLRKLTNQGVALLGGHTLNHDETAFGIVIVRADSQAAASEIMEADPLVRAHLVTVTVFPFEGLFGHDPQDPGPSSSGAGPDHANSGKGGTNPNDLKALTLAYINAVGQKRFDQLEALLAADMDFSPPAGKQIHGAQDYIRALERLSPILVRNEVKRVFVEGNEAGVIYDFVTDTPVGSVPTVEWLTFEGGRIRSSKLIFYSQAWPDVLKELTRRTSQAAAQTKQP